MRKFGAIFGREDSITGHAREVDEITSSAKRRVLRATGVAFAKLLAAEIKKMPGLRGSDRSQMLRATERFCDLAFREDPVLGLSRYGATLMEREMMRLFVQIPIDGNVFGMVKGAITARLAELPQDGR